MISIIDYGMGNLRSVEKAFQFLGAEVVLTNNPTDVDSSEAVVLPGVGAFSDCMENLHQRGLDESVKKVAEDGRPYLGICLGLQVLFDKSYEDGEHQGLGLIRGEVVRLPEGVKIPHIGWNQLNLKKPTKLTEEVAQNPDVYFVHSYCVQPAEDVMVATTNYGDDFVSLINKDSLYGVQFHPEKSGKAGLKMLENFIRMVKKS